MHSRQLFLYFLLGSLGIGAYLPGCIRSNSETPAVKDRYELPGNAAYPKGLAYQPSTGLFFTGNAQDGTLYRGNTKTGEVSVLSPAGADGRWAANGLALDANDRLWVAGGETGTVFLCDASTGALIRSYQTPPADSTLVNDLVVTTNGDVFVTDSYRPILFRIRSASPDRIEPWLDLSATTIRYGAGYNLNGIAVTDDGRYLIVIQSNTGQLFRISLTDKSVRLIDLKGLVLPFADGISLRGKTIYAARNQTGEIARIALNADLTSGTVDSPIRDASFRFPTAVTVVGDRLLVANAQLGRVPPQKLVLPFTLSGIVIP